ncbi:MAG: hypothetical protein NVS9B10_01830 [Nevskia sp.]
MPGRDFGERFLDQPVEAQAGPVPERVGDGRQGVDHIPQRRGFDHQDVHVGDGNRNWKEKLTDWNLLVLFRN